MSQVLQDKMDTLAMLAQPSTRASMGEADWARTLQHTLDSIKQAVQDSSAQPSEPAKVLLYNAG
jgi:hypothetical protein